MNKDEPKMTARKTPQNATKNMVKKKALAKSPKIQMRKELFLSSLRNTLGNVSEACRSAGVDRKFYYNRMRNDPDFVNSVTDIVESITDNAEEVIVKAIEGGDVNAAKWWLDKKGHSRGYNPFFTKEHQNTVHSSSIKVDDLPIDLQKQILDHIRRGK